MCVEQGSAVWRVNGAAFPAVACVLSKVAPSAGAPETMAVLCYYGASPTHNVFAFTFMGRGRK